MAIWYAQQSSTNIDRVSAGTTSDVWNAAADGSGAWMDISVLTAGGTDTVLAANGKTAITINTDIDIGTGRLSTAAEGTGAAGGGFDVASARTVRGNILAGKTTCVTIGNGAYTLTIYGNVTGGSAANAVGISGNGAASTIVVTGDVIGGSYISAYGITTSYSSTTVNGNLIATNAPAVYQSNNTTLTINAGNIINSVYSSAIYGRYPVVYNPGPGNYIEYPTTTGTAKYGKTIPAASVLSGVDGDGANAPATGTVTLPSEDDVKLGVEFGPGGALTGAFELVPDIDLSSVTESLAAIQAQTDRLVITDGKVAASADVNIDAAALASAIAEAVVDELGGGEGAVEYSDTIVSTAGDPIEGALIQLFSSPSQTPESRVTSTRTVELGAFVIYAPAGTYTMRVSHPEIESYVTEVTLS